ncbi:MAG: AMP-binding protein [Roseibacillus sp.]
MARFFTPPHLTEIAQELAQAHPQLDGSLFATSGTTSEPKWVLHSQEGLDWCAETVNKHFDCTSKDIWGLALPHFHVGGYCLTHRAKLAGGDLARFQEKWNAQAFHQWLIESQATITSLVPTQIFDLVSLRKNAPPALRLALIGGENLADSLFEKAVALGWPLVASYGMTETAGLVAASEIGKKDLNSLPGWDLQTNEQGLLTITSPGLFQGYLNADGLKKTLPPFTTQDLAKVSAHTLTIRGRSDDQIKILGELVDLAQLRKSLASTLPNHRSTVLPFPDLRRNFSLIPVIEGPPDNSLSDIISDWNQTLPAFSRCLSPTFIPQWPLTPLGKVDYRTLSEQVTNEQDSLLPDTQGSV